MRLGCCFGTDLNFAASLKDAGFDYGETNLKRMMWLDDKEFDAFHGKLEEIGLPIESACVFLTDGIYLNRLQADYAMIDAYLDSALKRCVQLGMKTIVFGSGGARTVPPELTVQQVFDDVALFLKEHVVPRVSALDIHIAIEPLSEHPCCINTVPEAIALMEAVDSEWVQVLSDNYHMARENDPIEGIAAARGRMIHAHISRPRGGTARTVPMHNDGYDPTPYMRQIVATGCPRLSIEANTKPETFWDESHDAILLLRETLQRIEQEA